MSYNFPYLKDSIFLKEFDKIKLKQQLVKLVVLDFKTQAPIQEIQGKVLGGSFTFDGSSAMRRTGNVTLVASDTENNLSNVNYLLSINKKIEVLIGFVNTTNQYLDYPVLWFPMGVYVIVNSSISHGSGGITITLTLHDKMALLNGECGGTLPASVIFSQVEEIDEEGNTYISNPTIYQIIQQLVNHFGEEQLGKIIISDLDNQIKKVMKWTGGSPLYCYSGVNKDGQVYYSLTTNYKDLKDENNNQLDVSEIQSYTYGDDVGYILTDFIYPGQLLGNAGDSIVTILDQIKNTLGNYQYFYDRQGNFHFQEIKNYLNNSFTTSIINEIKSQDYSINYSREKNVYSFDDANLILSYTNTPQYQQIKNDFVIWGKRKSIEGKEIPIRYHLAIDNKPKDGNMYQCFFYEDPDDGLIKAKKPLMFSSFDNLPKKGQADIYYCVLDGNSQKKKIYKWVPEAATYQLTNYELKTITTSDYRTELYFSGIDKQPFGLDSNYYFTQLKNEWPKIYNIETGKFKNANKNAANNLDYYLDLIDSSAAISEFSVNNIGRRTVTIVDDKINCIFEPEIPNLILIEAGSENANIIQDWCDKQGQNWVQVKSEVYSLLLTGGTMRSAYEQIRRQLYQYTCYNEQVSITTLPIYYLEPNTRISITNNQIGINGDYIIKSLTIPLDINGTMSISCTKAIDRL